MSNLREAINDLAHDLYQAEMIDTITLRDLTEKSLPELNEYTGQEIQVLRKNQHCKGSMMHEVSHFEKVDGEWFYNDR